MVSRYGWWLFVLDMTLNCLLFMYWDFLAYVPFPLITDYSVTCTLWLVPHTVTCDSVTCTFDYTVTWLHCDLCLTLLLVPLLLCDLYLWLYCDLTTLWLVPYTVTCAFDYSVTCTFDYTVTWLQCDLYLWLYYDLSFWLHCDLYHTMTCAYHCTLKCHPPSHLTFSFTFILFYCFIRYLSNNTSIYWFSFYFSSYVFITPSIAWRGLIHLSCEEDLWRGGKYGN